MKRMFLRMWMDKYLELYKLALILDEFIFLVSHKRLIKYQSDRALLHKYLVIMRECKKNPNSELCNSVCQQYNFNKFTYIIDGEGHIIKEFFILYGRFKKLMSSKKKYHKLVEMRKLSFLRNVFQRHVRNYTVLGNKVIPRPKKPIHERKKKTAINFGDKTNMRKRYFVRHHPWSTITLEAMDDQVNSFTLYRIKNNPVDIADFQVIIGGIYGVDPFKDRKNMNMDIKVKELLALQSHKNSDPMSLNEIIEPDVKKMLHIIDIARLKNFVTDHILRFDLLRVPKQD